MLGELTFFPGLQLSQSKRGSFISQMNYIKKMLKKFKIMFENLRRNSMVLNKIQEHGSQDLTII